jgi:ribose/xylose/arabinose/galactoside ABC-type transport system permease subunit
MFFGVHLSFRNKEFYIISFIVCLVLAIIVKFTRHSFFGNSEFLDILLGSSPSFLYLYGLISIIPVIKNNLEFTSYKKLAFMVTLGALTYEVEQVWSSRFFDYYDIAATILALTLMLVIHSSKQSKT